MTKILYYNNLKGFIWQIKRIVYNNKSSFDQAISNKISSFSPVYLPKEKISTNRPVLDSIRELLNIDSVIDRTGYLEHFNMAYAVIPTYSDTVDTPYYDVALTRAKQIWETDMTVDILFNGHTENLVACLSLIETKPKNKTLRIICLTPIDTVNIPIFKEFIVNKTHKEFFSVESLTPSNTTVVSDVPNIASLHTTCRKIPNINTHTVSWKYLMYLDIANRSKRVALSRSTFEFEIEKINVFLRNHIEQAPFPIISVNDALWWLAFTFTNNYLSYAVPVSIIQAIESTNPAKLNLSKWVNFFNNNDWQQWHMKNYNSNRNLDNFRNESETFVKSFINWDSSAYEHTDVQNYNLLHRPLLILDDGRIVYINNLSLDIVKELL
jgi:hypothetical protein